MKTIQLTKLGFFRGRSDVVIVIAHIVAIHQFKRRHTLIGLSNGRAIKVAEGFGEVNRIVANGLV